MHINLLYMSRHRGLEDKHSPRSVKSPQKEPFTLLLLLCILTSKRMLAHAFTWSKTRKNTQKIFKKYFFIVRMRDSRKAHATWNCWGANSFWVSTSVWESLLNAKKLHFSSCSCVSLTWVSRTYNEKSTFLNFQAFFIVFDHVNACASMPSQVEIHNN